jgi:hypothetical protein
LFFLIKAKAWATPQKNLWANNFLKLKTSAQELNRKKSNGFCYGYRVHLKLTFFQAQISTSQTTNNSFRMREGKSNPGKTPCNPIPNS